MEHEAKGLGYSLSEWLSQLVARRFAAQRFFAMLHRAERTADSRFDKEAIKDMRKALCRTIRRVPARRGRRVAV